MVVLASYVCHILVVDWLLLMKLRPGHLGALRFLHVLIRDDEKEGRKKQARSIKQQGKATQHTQGSHFSKEKLAASGGTRTHDTLLFLHVSACYIIALATYAIC